MKTIIIEGELGKEIEQQMTHLDSLGAAMDDLAQRKHVIGKRMWDHLKKEYPSISDNCNLSIIEGRVVLLDRLND